MLLNDTSFVVVVVVVVVFVADGDVVVFKWGASGFTSIKQQRQFTLQEGGCLGKMISINHRHFNHHRDICEVTSRSFRKIRYQALHVYSKCFD